MLCNLMTIYSYQNHQRNLRERQQMERLQEAVAEPDVIELPTENNEQQNSTESIGENQRNEGESTPLITPADTVDNSTAPSTTSVEQDENRLPTVTLLRTFILSFFSSLIPETPAV